MLAQRVKRMAASKTASRLLSKIKEGCELPRDCWKCEKALSCLKQKFFCPSCSAIQPLQENFFDYLGVRASFDVDTSLIKKHFLQLQSQIHPDKFTRCSMKEKEISEFCSSYLNDAYQTLTEPLRRAKYLLELKGQSCNAEETTTSNGDFMLLMMELNEEADSLQTEDEVKRMIAKVDENIDQLCLQFKNHFESQQMNAAKEDVLKMNFFYRLRANLNKKLGFC
ncbi:unnamed protein product [Anisakis simplex]|uniref:J domain-containing protein n=1 Tax=Anisakis simplex TaxID=6269 RepID=A0A0M3JSU6_ANISI|nr:unnamed protein product [Anisakis simplex]